MWGNYDPITGRFTPYDAAAAAAATEAAAAPGPSTAAESALALSNSAGYAARAGQGAAPQHTRQSLPRPKGAGAVIGAAAKLDAHGLLEAARAANEKALLLQKQAEMEREKEEAKAQAQAAQPKAPVAGVVHRGKWANRQQQQQQQQ